MRWFGYLYAGKSLTQKKPGPNGRRRDGKGCAQSEEQALVGNIPRWRSVVRLVCKGEMAPSRKEEEEPWDGSDLTIVFQEAVSFL